MQVSVKQNTRSAVSAATVALGAVVEFVSEPGVPYLIFRIADREYYRNALNLTTNKARDYLNEDKVYVLKQVQPAVFEGSR